MIPLDTSGQLATLDPSQRQRARTAAALCNTRGFLLLSPLVLAELDDPLAARADLHAALALLAEAAH